MDKVVRQCIELFEQFCLAYIISIGTLLLSILQYKLNCSSAGGSSAAINGEKLMVTSLLGLMSSSLTLPGGLVDPPEHSFLDRILLETTNSDEQ